MATKGLVAYALWFKGVGISEKGWCNFPESNLRLMEYEDDKDISIFISKEVADRKAYAEVGDDSDYEVKELHLTEDQLLY
jgi:hypothetical protein